jgi:hypothetical protein
MQAEETEILLEGLPLPTLKLTHAVTKGWPKIRVIPDKSVACVVTTMPMTTEARQAANVRGGITIMLNFLLLRSLICDICFQRTKYLLNAN